MHDETLQATPGGEHGEGAREQATPQVQGHDWDMSEARPVQEEHKHETSMGPEASEAFVDAMASMLDAYDDESLGVLRRVEVAEDVPVLIAENAVFKSGVYYMDKTANPEFSGPLMRLEVDKDDLVVTLDDSTEKAGSDVRPEDLRGDGSKRVRMSFSAVPYIPDGVGRPMSLQEVAAWSVWAGARAAGRPDVAAEVVDSIYTPKDGNRTASEIAAENESRALEGNRDGSHLPRQDMVKPTTHYVPNSKFANMIAEVAAFNGETVELDVSSAREQKAGREVMSAVSVSIEDVEGLDVSKPIDAFDSDAQSAVATLYVAGNEYMTPAQICQTLTGSKKPTKKQIDDVEKSIDKQMRAYAKADMTAEARGRRLKIDGSPVESYTLEGYLIPAEKVSIRSANGRMVSGYHMLRAPLLYRHAHALGQVVSFPQKMLETDIAGSNTRTRSAIKNYLARRIGQIKGKGSVSNRILLSKVYEKAEVDPDNRKQRNAANKYASELLDLWSEKGFITSYRKESQGSSHKLIAFVIKE